MAKAKKRAKRIPVWETLEQNHVRRMERGKYLERFVFPQKHDLPRVDWEKLVSDRRKHDAHSGSDEHYQPYYDVLRYLRIKRILTTPGTPGDYFLLGSGMDLSPGTEYGTTMHFVRKEDAEEYAAAEFGRKRYNLFLCKNLKKI
jgi:hypothetical protein